MASLPQLAFSFAQFVAREHRRSGYPRRTFARAAARRWNSGRRHQRRPEWNGGLRRRHHGNRWVSRRRFGPGGGLRRRLRGNRWAPQQHNRHGNHWMQRHRAHGAPGTSTRDAVRREQTQVAAVEPAVVAVPEVAAEEAVGALNEDEASASNAFVDADELLKSEWLIDDPEHNFGYNPPPEFSSPPDAIQPGAEMQEVGVAAPAPATPVPRAQAEENEDAALIDIPTPSPEARVLLRTFTSAMAARPVEIHAGTWSPALLGLTNRLEGLRLDDLSEGTNRR